MLDENGMPQLKTLMLHTNLVMTDTENEEKIYLRYKNNTNTKCVKEGWWVRG